MTRQKNKKKTILAALLLAAGMQATVQATVQTTVQAQEATMYTYFIKEDNSVSRDNPMDAVAAVKSTNSSLSGISYNSTSGVLTLNGLKADTLRVYAKNIHISGENTITNFVVNTTIEKVSADNGSQFNCTKASGRKKDTFYKELPDDMTGSGTSVSKGDISLDKTSASIYAKGTGSTVKLNATTQGSGTVKWSSSDTNVAVVENGTVTPKKAGTVVITATLVNSNNAEVGKATCTVKIVNPTITLDKGTGTIYEKGINTSLILTATANGATSGNAVTWSSSNTSVATVTNGTVKAVKAGSATITATSNGVSATCKVTVKEPTISLNKSSVTLYTKGEKTITLVAKENGTEVTGANVTWKSSDTSVATVENGKITAVAKGTATITAKENGVSTTCKVTVKNPSVSVSPTSVTLKKGKTSTLTTTVKPSSGTPSYSSNKKSVAKVSSSGVITAVAAGEATITVTCNGASATVKVTVTN